MEIQFPPEVEAGITQLAMQSGRGKDEIVIEMVTNQISYDAWFQREVEKGIASLNRGEFVEHAEVKRQMERTLGA